MKKCIFIIIFTTTTLLFTACNRDSEQIESIPTPQLTHEQATETTSPLESAPEQEQPQTQVVAEAPVYITIRGEQFSTSLTTLDLARWGLTNEEILPLRYMVNLEELIIANTIQVYGDRYSGLLSDITPLAELTNLKTLNLRGNNINDITPLANMTQLVDLMLGGNQINDITPLAGLTQLRYLDMMDNQISDIAVVSNFPNLVFLDATKNQITDITPLVTLINLDFLGLSLNPIRNIAPLAELTNLTRLTLEYSQINDITPLGSLTNLTFLLLSGNPITDWSPVEHVVDVNGRPLRLVERITAVERDTNVSSSNRFNVRTISETLVDTGFGMYDDFGGCILVFELENISGRGITVDISAVFRKEHGHAAWLIDQDIHFEPGQARQFTHSFGEYNYSDSLHLIIEYWNVRY